MASKCLNLTQNVGTFWHVTISERNPGMGARHYRDGDGDKQHWTLQLVSMMLAICISCEGGFIVFHICEPMC